MSPVPGPTPLRSKALNTIFSPTGLLLGFVVLIIATCPGARGEHSLGLLAGNDTLLRSSAVDLAGGFNAPGTQSRPSAMIERPTVLDRASASPARSATPVERGLRGPETVAATETFPYSRTTLPLLIDHLSVDAVSAPISPMTGPAVGIQPKNPPVARRR